MRKEAFNTELPLENTIFLIVLAVIILYIQPRKIKRKQKKTNAENSL